MRPWPGSRMRHRAPWPTCVWVSYGRAKSPASHHRPELATSSAWPRAVATACLSRSGCRVILATCCRRSRRPCTGSPRSRSPTPAATLATRPALTGQCGDAARAAGVVGSTLRRWRRLGESGPRARPSRPPQRTGRLRPGGRPPVRRVNQAEGRWASKARPVSGPLLSDHAPSGHRDPRGARQARRRGRADRDPDRGTPRRWRPLVFLLDRHEQRRRLGEVGRDRPRPCPGRRGGATGGTARHP